MDADQIPAEIVEAAVRAVQDADARAARRGYSAGARPGIVAARVLTAAWPLIAAHVQRLPRPEDGCVCSWESEDRGGGDSELVAEYEPACPVHSEHLYDPRTGVWVLRAKHDREVQARALEEAAERAWMNRYSGASHALRKYAARLRTPDAGVGGGERG